MTRTRWRVNPPVLRKLTTAAREFINSRVNLDDGDRKDMRLASRLHREIDQALSRYSTLQIWHDEMRVSNQLAALQKFRGPLQQLSKIHAALDEHTAQLLDLVNDPDAWKTQTDKTRRSHVGGLIETLVTTVNATETYLRREAKGGGRHGKTHIARDILIAELLEVFAKYAPPISDDRRSEKTEIEQYIGTILVASGVPCPKGEKLRRVVGRAINSSQSNALGPISRLYALKKPT